MSGSKYYHRKAIEAHEKARNEGLNNVKYPPGTSDADKGGIYQAPQKPIKFPSKPYKRERTPDDTALDAAIMVVAILLMCVLLALYLFR